MSGNHVHDRIRVRQTPIAMAIAVVAVVVAMTGSAVAATGGNLILGRGNSAGASTSLANTGKGPALVLKTRRLSTPPLSVGKNRSKVVNLNADLLDGVTSTQFQRRVSAGCSNGQAIVAILATGKVNCGGPDLSPYQHRVSGACTGATAIQSVAADGTVTCGDDTSTLQRRVDGTCAGATAVQSVGADGSVTCGNDTSGLQKRVSGTCAGSTAVQSVGADGGVTCTSTSLFAVVTAAAGLARGSGVSGIAKDTGSGHYIVTFNRDVTLCAYVADTGLTGSSSTQPASFATVAGATGNANGVYVTTYNSGASATDEPFHLIVMC